MFANVLVAASRSWAYGWTGMVFTLGILFSYCDVHTVSGYQFRVSWRYNNNNRYLPVRIFHFICYSPQTVGVIVRLERENFHVLNMQGKVVEARPQALQKRKDSRYAVALDSEQNTIQKKDIVKVIDGPHAVSNFQGSAGVFSNVTNFFIEGGSNMTGTVLCANKPHCAEAVRP